MKYYDELKLEEIREKADIDFAHYSFRKQLISKLVKYYNKYNKYNLKLELGE